MTSPADKGETRGKPSAAAMTRVVDLVVETNAINEKSKDTEKKHSLNYLAIIGGQSLVIVFLLWLAFVHFPQGEFIPTQNAAAICKVTPVEQPRLTNAQVMDYAKDMAVSIYSTDYANYRTTVTDAAGKYMLPDFRDQFIKTMSNSDFLKLVVEGRFVVSAVTTANRPPQVVRAGLLNGAYAWKIQVPLTLFYQSGRTQQDDRVVAEVTVTQVDPTRVNLNSRGIAVSWLELKPAIN